MSYALDKIELLLKDGMGIGTIFDLIIQNPYKYCSPDLADVISNNLQSYKDQIDKLKLKECYSLHLQGLSVLKSLFNMGFPEAVIIRYIVYPGTYQFRTHLPFIDNIQIINDFPDYQYPSLPILEPYLGQTEVIDGNLSLPVVRYATPGGGAEFNETPLDICGTFYYPQNGSDILLKFNSCLIVPNKIVAYHYLFNKDSNDIATDLIELDQYSYFEQPMLFKTIDICGFNAYYVDFNKADLEFVYNLIKSHLSVSFNDLINKIGNSPVVTDVQTYFDDLTRQVGDNIENVKYFFRGEIQDKDVILFMVSYIKYAAIKMMIKGTWNYRVSLWYPYTKYDQLICNKASDVGIDVIILVTENSTGVTRIRTEIVDTRPRNVSYNNLRIRNDSLIFRRREYEKLEMDQSLSQGEMTQV